jgi:hypothetical protein
MIMRVVRSFCWLALLAGAIVCHLDGAIAQGTADQQQACTPDAMRLCADVIPDVAKVTACMHAKSSQLSEACRIAMRGSHHHYRRCRHHCG